MDKIYKVTELNLLDIYDKNREVFLVKGNRKDIEELCNKMGQYKNSTTKSVYDVSLLDYKVYDINGDLYQYYLYKDMTINNVDYERTGYALCTKEQMENMKQAYEKANDGVVVDYEQTKVYDIDSAYKAYNDYMERMHSNYRIYKDDEINEETL